MLLKLFLAFTIIPVVEIYLLMTIGSQIGIIATLSLVLLTGFLGASLARLQGVQTMMRVRSSLEQGIVPGEEMVDAVLIFAAGVVLLTPGFLTDLFGLLLLYPETRRRFKTYLRNKFDSWVVQHRQPPRYYS